MPLSILRNTIIAEENVNNATIPMIAKSIPSVPPIKFQKNSNPKT